MVNSHANMAVVAAAIELAARDEGLSLARHRLGHAGERAAQTRDDRPEAPVEEDREDQLDAEPLDQAGDEVVPPQLFPRVS